jgi:DNA transformation protein and related proteins
LNVERPLCKTAFVRRSDRLRLRGVPIDTTQTASMATPHDEFTRHCSDLLAAMGRVRTRRMFGGVGMYVDEVFIALIADERLYLKTDDTTRARFEAAGCEPFVFDSAKGLVSTSYFSAPEDAMESPPLMQAWARLALEAALRARAARPASASRKRAAAAPAPAATARKGTASAPAKPAATSAAKAAKKPPARRTGR